MLAVRETGVTDVQNQFILLRDVNDSTQALPDLCFALSDEASITPYYFYMCDRIKHAEHWRLSLHKAQDLQTSLLGRLPGFATPRIVCDVPLVGRQWVHQVKEYDRERGVSYWDKNSRPLLDSSHPRNGSYVYYDPIHTLPQEGRAWWETFRSHHDESLDTGDLAQTTTRRPIGRVTVPGYVPVGAWGSPVEQRLATRPFPPGREPARPGDTPRPPQGETAPSRHRLR
ncbi:hypothetical protein QR77_00340 [Streptomyces sp. 150FB]|uniref:hypothetical protein n=1 Tax=Streptomyces sp. 150FB TaxID=1576605 RepID=UPI000589135C|nr:hypothetical protein [Streptomyces sp. 150FB]KIF72873.1 hypothetical protein QR77_00340 [Streptomyces sp. 150FB]